MVHGTSAELTGGREAGCCERGSTASTHLVTRWGLSPAEVSTAYTLGMTLSMSQTEGLPREGVFTPISEIFILKLYFVSLLATK